MADAPQRFTAPALAGVAHGFMGRQGGVSTGAVASLNCGLGSGDDPARVAENRARAAEAVRPGVPLVSVYQVHSATCVTVDEPWPDTERPSADALVTDRPGAVLGILTADCAPVLLADRSAGVIGAAHAGWKGAVGGVTDATVAAMVALGASPERIVAAIGPCIAQPSYEVDAGFFDCFNLEDADNARFFAFGRDGHFQFDLEGYVAARLAAAGVGTVERLSLDTYVHEDDFYSFRRASHRGEPDYGRQISLIALA